MRGCQIVVPSSLRAKMIALAHEGHQSTDRTLNLLRQTCWFPAMRKSVREYVESCVACISATSHNPPVPLQPNMLPKGPWQKLHCDFKGPIGSKYYLHVIVDQYSKYPEVDLVTSTSFEKLKPSLDRVFANHGIPESMSSDNGPPYPSHQMKEYAKNMGFKMTPVAPDDPQCNGFAENFMKPLTKMIHAAIIEKKDPKSELHRFLLQYRATPHSTTDKSPAEMLFNRKIKTRLPQMNLVTDSIEQAEVRETHDRKKLQQKYYFDKKHKARPKTIKLNDKVLIKQNKTTIQPPLMQIHSVWKRSTGTSWS